LHSLLGSQSSKDVNIGMVISFKKSALLSKTTKVKFYADPEGVNLLAEYCAGSEQRTHLQPILLNHGKVWCHYDSGNAAILPLYMQSSSESMLPCLINFIPSEWTTCC
jgi:hypothetical protein